MRRIRDLQGRLLPALCLGAALAAPAACRGDVIASDIASDPAYSNGWQGLNGFVPSETGSDNGGSGFLPWDFEADEGFWEAEHCPYPDAHFIDTKPTSFNNLGAPAFAITNANVPLMGYTTVATRPFALALKVGDRISVDIDNPVMQKLAEFDSAGFIVRLQTAGGSERLGFYTTQDFNNDEWTITDSRGDRTATGLTDQAGSSGFHFAVQLTGDESYRLTIQPLAGGTPSVFQGMLAGAGKGPITKIQFLMFGNGSGNGRTMATGEREFYFNNLKIESGEVVPLSIQKPGDCNQDGALDLSDAVCLLLRLFQGGTLPCEEGISDPGNRKLLDSNGDGGADLSDAVFILGFLFRGTDAPVLGTACQPIEGCPDNGAKCE